MSLRRDLLSSTAPPASDVVYAQDLTPRPSLHAITRPPEAPHTITFDDLKLAMDRADEIHRRRPFISMEEMQELSRRLIPTELNYTGETHLFVQLLKRYGKRPLDKSSEITFT